MSSDIKKPLLGKVILRGVIHTLSGLHIGTSKEVLEIGSVDLAVVREPVTKEPYIPGSSLKGKLRSLLEKKIAGEKGNEDFFNRNIGTARFRINIHACESKEKAFECNVCRLFGTSAGPDSKDKTSNFPARLKFRDSYFTKYTKEELERAETGYLYTEVKFENALDRVTAASNPRQIERVPVGSDFAFEVVYDVEAIEHVEEDLKNLLFAFSTLEDDYLGGHGSRGSGKVKVYFSEVIAKKADAYKLGETDGLVMREKAERAITRESDERPENYEEDLLDVDKVREFVDRLGSFFRKSGESS